MLRTITLLLLIVTAQSSNASNLSNSQGEWYFWAPDQTRIYTRTLGTAKPGIDPVIVLHGGFGADHSYLIPALQPEFAARQFVFFDQRGSLRSPASTESISWNSLISDLEQLREELGLKQVTLLAHSMGSAVAYEYLAQHPTKVKNLVLIGPVFPFYPGTGPDKEMLAQLQLPTDESSIFVRSMLGHLSQQRSNFESNAKTELKEERLDHEPRNGRERTAQWLISYASANLYDISKWREMLGGQAFYNPDVYPALIKNSGGADAYRDVWGHFFPALQSYRGRLTLIVGTKDFIDSRYEYWPRIHSQLPSARVIPINYAGHNLWIDQPAEFSAALKEAL